MASTKIWFLPILILVYWAQQSEAIVVSPAACAQYLEWKNQDNRGFYEYLPLEDFESQTESVGLANGEDLRNGYTGSLLKSVVQQAEIDGRLPFFLEVGAGYGRVVSVLREEHPESMVVALERSEKYVTVLNEKFANDPGVIIWESDVLNPFLNHDFFGINLTETHHVKFDVATFMFTMLGEFRRQEQFRVLKNVQKLLEKDGYIVIDLVDPTPLSQGKSIFPEEEFVTVAHPDTMGHTLNVRLTGIQEVQMLVERAGYTFMGCSPYDTTTGKPRLACHARWLPRLQK